MIRQPCFTLSSFSAASTNPTVSVSSTASGGKAAAGADARVGGDAAAVWVSGVASGAAARGLADDADCIRTKAELGETLRPFAKCCATRGTLRAERSRHVENVGAGFFASLRSNCLFGSTQPVSSCGALACGACTNGEGPCSGTVLSL